MAGNLAAVLGTGQTKYVAKRKDVSMNGLVREAIDKALADSGSTFDDIDAVVVGKAPDFFEGVMMPELFMADAVGATGKPLIRVHTAGSVGGSTAIVAASLVQSGKYKRVLTMAWEKQSESNAMWALSIPVPFTKPVGAGAGGYFAPHVRSYIRRSGAPTHIGAMVAVKDRLNGAKNPLAHLHQPDITLEKVMASQMLWDPIRFDETCPSSDGACALVIGNEEIADRRVADGHPVAWIHATALRTEPLAYSGRDQVNPQAGRDASAALWRDAGITSPIDEIDVAEVYVPFSWFEPMWLENLGFAAEGEGWKLTEAGETAIGGRIPFNAVRRRAVDQSDRRIGHDPVRRVGHPGDGQGRRPPGRGCPQGARPRLRRWLAVLLDVGGERGQARLEVTDSPVHLAGKRSREAAIARDKEAWLAVFADDAIVEDPIGPSHFDPEGKGHRGKDAIAKFFDMAIAPSQLEFHFEQDVTSAATRRPTSATS